LKHQLSNRAGWMEQPSTLCGTFIVHPTGP
jgi:hypothetical protein